MVGNTKKILIIRLQNGSKAHAKTFMSVLYSTGRAEVAMKKAGHPNIFVAQGEFTKDSDQTKKVLDQIKATTTEVVKKGANQTVKVSIGGQGVTVTKATLKGAVNKELPIKDGKVEFSEALADGSYTLEYVLFTEARQWTPIWSPCACVNTIATGFNPSSLISSLISSA